MPHSPHSHTFPCGTFYLKIKDGKVEATNSSQLQYNRPYYSTVYPYCYRCSWEESIPKHYDITLPPLYTFTFLRCWCKAPRLTGRLQSAGDDPRGKRWGRWPPAQPTHSPRRWVQCPKWHRQCSVHLEKQTGHQKCKAYTKFMKNQFTYH